MDSKRAVGQLQPELGAVFQDEISRKMIRSIYNEHLGTYCQEDSYIKRLIVAYSRPKI